MSPGEIVFSGQLLLAIPIALLAGLISFASPCVLPLVPGYLGYISGGTGIATTRLRAVSGASLFVVGFGAVFVAYGAAFGAMGAWLVQWQDVVVRALGVLVIVMGLVFVGQLSFLQRTVKPNWQPRVGLVGAPMLGIVFGLGWTPCFGPTLATISVLSLDSSSALRGAALGLAYCLGLGAPFILIALGFAWAKRSIAVIRRHIRSINVVGGIALVLIGALMVTGAWTWITLELQGFMLGFVAPL